MGPTPLMEKEQSLVRLVKGISRPCGHPGAGAGEPAPQIDPHKKCLNNRLDEAFIWIFHKIEASCARPCGALR
jgi:hypothetical protein